ncbi:MAG: patatin-like phospholipase family protein [Nitrospirae bacterium]|nr:patatin-like phospholipase family protein [Nitrospirota bacterium]
MAMERRGKTALVLAGGGFPGFMYEIGCLTAMDEIFEPGFNVNQFDIYVGASAGSAIASLIANGVRPREIFDAILNDTVSPYNFKRENIYSFGYQETWLLFKRLMRTVPPLVRYFVRRRASFSMLDLVYMLQENLPSGIFTLKNFDAYLADFFAREGRTNDFRKLRRQLYIPAVDIDRGRYDVFGEAGYDDVPISQAVIASSAMPIVFQPVTIKGRDYMDGGVGKVAYMDVAINHGAELMLVLNPVQRVENDRNRICLTSLRGECVSIKEKGLSFIYDQAQRINTASRLYMAMKRYKAEHPEKDFLLLQPDPSDAVMFLYNVINMSAKLEVLNYGYKSTIAAVTEQFDSYRECFAKCGIKVTLDRLVSKKRKWD